MAWIMSATNGRAVTGGHLRSLQAILLVAHLAMLVLLCSRPIAAADPHQGAAGSAPELIAAASGSATVALVTGLLLAFFMFASTRPRAAATAAANTREPAPRPDAGHRRADVDVQHLHEGLMARLSHDLRTPLNAIIGFADLMKTETFGPLGNDRYRDYAAHMQSCGHDLLRATESTLAMASLLTNRQGRDDGIIAVAELVEECWAVVTRSHNAGERALQLDIDRSIEVCGDESALRQSLIYLLGLALERSGAAGQVAFAAVRSHGRVEARISVTGCETRARIARTGCRPRTSATAGIDELAIGVSRALLGLNGVPLVETADLPGGWTVAMSLEASGQADFFAAAKPAQAYLGGLGTSASRSA